MILVYSTCKDEREARSIGRTLLKKKVAACVNVFPIASIFLNKGEINDAAEVGLLVKSTEKHFEELSREVERVHSYEVPCILKIPVSCNAKYKNWLEAEVN